MASRAKLDRHRGDQEAQGAERHDAGVRERAARRRHPQHHRLEAAHQAAREAEADQGARNGQGHDVVADREQQRAGRGAAEQAGLDAARPVAVEQHAQGQLEQREGEQIGRGQEAEGGRAEADVGGEVRPDHGVDRTEQVGEEVAEREGRQDREHDRRGRELCWGRVLWQGVRPKRQATLPI